MQIASENSPSRNSPRGLSAKRFDMKVIMKIIHCSDLHLDADLRTNFAAARAAERRAELLGTFRRLCFYAKEQSAAAVLICGDLFDTDSPSPSAVRTVEDLILSCPDLLFFYLRGNHDGRPVLFRSRPRPDNLFLFEQSWSSWELSSGSSGERRVCITGREPGPEPFTSPDLDPACLNIVMLHGQVRDGYSAPDPEALPMSALRGRGIDYLALGHLHHYRSFALDERGTAAYCGTLEGRGFDECGSCGFILLETDEHGRGLKSHFVPFASRNLYRIDCPVTGCTSDTEIYERMARVLEASPASQADLVRLEVTGELDYGCSPDPAFVQREWEDRYHYFEYKSSAEPVVHTEDFLCDASLKGEFVRVVSADEALNARGRAEVLRCGLRALSGESLF